MIISSYDDIPYFTCKSAEIRPKSKTEYSGRFEAEGKTFTINILDERNEKKSVSRVWARIGLVKQKPEGKAIRFALDIAAKQKTDPAFIPVKVDLRDGETSYMQTWTRNYPDDEAMDRFVEACKSFIQDHFDEIDGTSFPQSDQGIAELLNLL